MYSDAWSLFQLVLQKDMRLQLVRLPAVGRAQLPRYFCKLQIRPMLTYTTNVAYHVHITRLSATIHLRRRSGWWELWIIYVGSRKENSVCRAIKALFPWSSPVQFSYTLVIFAFPYSEVFDSTKRTTLCLPVFSWPYCWDTRDPQGKSGRKRNETKLLRY